MKEHIFKEPRDLDLLHDCVLEAAEKLNWNLSAWAFFSNHYHLIGQAPHESDPVKALVKACHGRVAVEINRRHGTAGRKVFSLTGKLS